MKDRDILTWLLTLVVASFMMWISSGVRGEEGLASWYGPGFHGQQTASGEIYNQHGPTCASNGNGHVLGDILKVTNLKNGKWTLCRVNDRGPFVRGRIIDVSLFVAQRLDMVDDGVVPVKVEVRR
jgi:rare lipoprotein A